MIPIIIHIKKPQCKNMEQSRRNTVNVMAYSKDACNMWSQHRWGTKLCSCLKQISCTYLYISRWFMGLLRQSRMQPGWGTGVSRKCARFCKKRAGGGLWGVRTISGHWGYSTPQSWTFLETVGNRNSKRSTNLILFNFTIELQFEVCIWFAFLWQFSVNPR